MESFPNRSHCISMCMTLLAVVVILAIVPDVSALKCHHCVGYYPPVPEDKCKCASQNPVRGCESSVPNAHWQDVADKDAEFCAFDKRECTRDGDKRICIFRSGGNHDFQYIKNMTFTAECVLTVKPTAEEFCECNTDYCNGNTINPNLTARACGEVLPSILFYIMPALYVLPELWGKYKLPTIYFLPL